ncbi:MAG: hypothetical protein IJX97_04160 [Clostridia bacterium]|nr:hypothetical protein [Clostridia bacterium]MBQ8720064.1 hypothetical protein [Clostridia bacterium]
MQKIICKKLYDTETAEVIKKTTFGCFGDPKGYEETLCRMPDGAYFIYTNGGAESPYTEEGIKRLSEKNAQAWLLEHN